MDECKSVLYIRLCALAQCRELETYCRSCPYRLTSCTHAVAAVVVVF